MQRLGGIVRRRSRFTHTATPVLRYDNAERQPLGRGMLLKGRKRLAGVTVKKRFGIDLLRIGSGLSAMALMLGGCGPRAHIPPMPMTSQAERTTDSVAALARSLAPVL